MVTDWWIFRADAEHWAQLPLPVNRPTRPCERQRQLLITPMGCNVRASWRLQSFFCRDFHLYCHPAYLNSMQSTSCKCQADESQAGIKIARRNINNLRYVGDTTLTAHREEELKSLLMRVQDQSEKAVLKLNIQKNNIMASSSITSCQIEGEKVEAVTDFIFLGSRITVDSDCSHEIKRHLLLGRKAVTNLAAY